MSQWDEDNGPINTTADVGPQQPKVWPPSWCSVRVSSPPVVVPEHHPGPLHLPSLSYVSILSVPQRRLGRLKAAAASRCQKTFQFAPHPLRLRQITTSKGPCPSGVQSPTPPLSNADEGRAPLRVSRRAERCHVFHLCEPGTLGDTQ